MRTSSIALIAAAFGICAALAAKGDENASINNVFGNFGFTTERQPGKNCALKMMIDRKKFIEAVPRLKAMNMLNPEYVTQTRVNMEPTTLAMAFSMQMSPTVVKDLYDGDEKADRCKFTQAVTLEDDYGNDKTLVLFSFEFTRAIYKKINWDKFPFGNMSKVSINYLFGPAMQEVMHEREGAGD